MRNADPLTALVLGKLGRPDEILHPEPLLEPLFAELEVFGRCSVCGREPHVEARTHQ